jgi:hypothetical protein
MRRNGEVGGLAAAEGAETAAAAAVAGADGVVAVMDVAELTWPQREKVLRLLFTRIMAQNAQAAHGMGISPP